MIMKRKWHQIAAHPRDEQAGTRLVVPAKPANESTSAAGVVTLSKIEREKPAAPTLFSPHSATVCAELLALSRLAHASTGKSEGIRFLPARSH